MYVFDFRVLRLPLLLINSEGSTMRRTLCIIFLLAGMLAPVCLARTGSYSAYSSHSGYATHSGSSHSRSGSATRSPRTYTYPHSTISRRSYPNAGSYAPSATRDARGRIKRSGAAKNAFKRQLPCPSTGRRSGSCPGYVIDHVKPLECGGADAPANMQWQSLADGKAKDKTERSCR